MNLITTTELRTKSSQLVKTLKKGESVSLVHRSKVIGKIQPTVEEKVMTQEAINKLKDLMKDLRPRKIIPRSKREKIYRQRLEEKYGKGIS